MAHNPKQKNQFQPWSKILTPVKFHPQLSNNNRHPVDDGVLVGAGFTLCPLHLPLKATITQGSIQNSKVVIPKKLQFLYTSPKVFCKISLTISKTNKQKMARKK